MFLKGKKNKLAYMRPWHHNVKCLDGSGDVLLQLGGIVFGWNYGWVQVGTNLRWRKRRDRWLWEIRSVTDSLKTPRRVSEPWPAVRAPQPFPVSIRLLSLVTQWDPGSVATVPFFSTFSPRSSPSPCCRLTPCGCGDTHRLSEEWYLQGIHQKYDLYLLLLMSILWQLEKPKASFLSGM